MPDSLTGWWTPAASSTKMVFASSTGARSFRLPYAVNEEVVIDDTFATLPQIARQRLERDRQVLQRLVEARSSARVAAGIHDVWEAAHRGTITLLAVEEGYRYPARIRPDGGLVGQHDPAPPGVLDDAVDEVIEITLRNDGDVRFVADEHVAEWGGIAAVTRARTWRESVGGET